MKFLILGCNGMAGHTVALYLKEQGHEVVGFGRRKSSLLESIVGDATNFNVIRDVVRAGKYDTIINCVGILNQFAEEDKQSAITINSLLPHYLANITDGTDTQIIHMSTDCVFSGKRGQYTENDEPDNTTFYGRTKALGELKDNKNLTLRNSVVGPDINRDGIGLLNWFMQQKREITGYAKVIWTGLTSLELARCMEFASKERIFGLYNMVPDASISKYELLSLFNLHFRNKELKIVPQNEIVENKSLKRTNYKFVYKVPDYEYMIANLSKWMINHKNLYPHYSLVE